LRSTYAHIKSIEDELDYDNPVYPYKRYSEDKWASLNSTVHFGKSGGEPRDDKQFVCSYKAANHELIKDPVLTSDYRSRWINEPEPVLREQRFTSAMVAGLAGTVPGKFAPSVQRFLVGVPKAVEILRDRAVEALGTDGVLRLHVLLPPRWKRSASSMVNPLQISLKDVCGIKINIDQANELYKYLDPLQTNEAHRSDLITALLSRPLDGMRQQAVHNAWGVLLELGRGTVSIGTVRKCFDPLAHVDIRKNPPFIKDVLGYPDPALASNVFIEGLRIICAQRRRGQDFEQPGVQNAKCNTPEEIHTMKEIVKSCIHSAADGLVDDSTVINFHDFEDFCTFLHAGILSDTDFCRMLGVGLRIGAPVLVSGEPLTAGSTVRRPKSPQRGGASSAGNGTAGSPGRKAREALRTTCSDYGSGLAFATIPYRPGEGASERQAMSPNRRQSQLPPGMVDADAAAAAALSSVVVLVEFENGRKALQKIPKDRFLDVHDKVALLDRLTKAGVRNIKDCKVDF
jgi:hypothetical protein